MFGLIYNLVNLKCNIDFTFLLNTYFKYNIHNTYYDMIHIIGIINCNIT